MYWTLWSLRINTYHWEVFIVLHLVEGQSSLSCIDHQLTLDRLECPIYIFISICIENDFELSKHIDLFGLFLIYTVILLIEISFQPHWFTEHSIKRDCQIAHSKDQSVESNIIIKQRLSLLEEIVRLWPWLMRLFVVLHSESATSQQRVHSESLFKRIHEPSLEYNYYIMDSVERERLYNLLREWLWNYRSINNWKWSWKWKDSFLFLRSGRPVMRKILLYSII